MVIETSRPIAEAGGELGMNEASPGNWVRPYRERHVAEDPALQVSERARLRAGARERRAADVERVLSKAAAYVCP
jgi:transposase